MFSDVVALYRVLNRPQVAEDGTFAFSGSIDAEARQMLETCIELPAQFGDFDCQFSADGTVHLDGAWPMNDSGRFYDSYSSFFNKTPSIAFGALPVNFYIADIDYFSGDVEKPPVIVAVEKLAEFIRLLAAFAEDRAEFGNNTNRLLFVLPPSAKDKPQRTVVMEVRPEEAALRNPLIHLRLLEELVDERNAKKLHIEERRLVMRSAIGDVLGGASSGENLLTLLSQKWSEVLQKYRHNFQAYINNFAFDEVRKKIADSEIEYASKLSGVLGDIAGKLLALPVSLVALVALDEAKSVSAFVIGCIGLAIVSVVYLFILRNLWLQADRLKSSFDLAFSPFFNKLNTYPSPLRKVLEERKRALERQMGFLKLTFGAFYGLACVPALGAIWKIAARYYSEISIVVGELIKHAAAIFAWFH